MKVKRLIDLELEIELDIAGVTLLSIANYYDIFKKWCSDKEVK